MNAGDELYLLMTPKQAQDAKDAAHAKLLKDVSNIINEYSASLQQVAHGGSRDSRSVSSSAARPTSASLDKDSARQNLLFELPPTLCTSNGTIEWRIPAGVSKVGNAMKNAVYVREWKSAIDNALSKAEIFASSKVSEEGPEDLSAFWECESNYWGEPMALLKSPPYRAVLLTCRADRSLNRQWKSTMSNLSQRFASAHDCAKFLKLLSSLFFKLHSHCSIPVAIETLPQIVNAAHAVYSLCRYGSKTQIMTSFFARISNRLIEICKFTLECGRLWKMLQQDATETNSKLRSCVDLLEEYPRVFKLAQEESEAAYVEQPAPSVDRSTVFARTKLFSERLKKLLDVTDARMQFDIAISTGIDGLAAAVQPFREQFVSFCSKISDPLNLSGEARLNVSPESVSI